MQSHQKLIVFTLLTMTLNNSCKQKDTSDLSATTKLGGVTLDLSKYTAATSKEYEDFKNEIGPSSYDRTFKELDSKKIQPKGAMSVEEVVALRYYTSNDYLYVNTALRGTAPTALLKYDSTIKTIASGLNKIPTQSCTAYRSTQLTGAMIAEIKKTNRLVELAFMSTTTDRSVLSNWKGNVMIEIISDHCRDISWLSEIPSEKEVLFPPGSEFQVLDVKISLKKTTFIVSHITATSPVKTTSTAAPAAVKAKAVKLNGGALDPPRPVKGWAKMIFGTKKGTNTPALPSERKKSTSLVDMSSFSEENASSSEGTDPEPIEVDSYFVK